ncbi:AMP-dependent synthetase [halophilic archaeon]|nr:AMP-dependent synthetase [halophilic archaeon]
MAQSPKLWSDEYEQFGIPDTLEPYPDEPVHRFLYEAADEHPEQGVVQFGRKFTYPEIVDEVERLATALREKGVTKGSRVATILPTSMQFIVATNAISRAGGVHIPNDFLDAKEDLVYRLEEGRPEVLIGHDEHHELIRSLSEELGIEDVILTSIDDYSADAPADHEELDGVDWWTDVVADAEPRPPDVEFDVEQDVHTLLFTGGTTGLPKGCLLTHRNLVANALQGVAAQSRISELMRGSEAAVMALPMYHAYGYSVANSLLDLALDVLVVPDARDTELMSRLIEEHSPIIMLGVPTQFMEIVDEELENDVIGISGSAPLANETKEQFQDESRGVSQGYGLSEMSPITHFNVRGLQESLTGSSDETVGYDQPSIGVPVPDTEVKLVDVDSEAEIPLERAAAEELEGEMLVRGPQRMKGYLDEGKQPFDEEGFVSTGDVAKVDSNGQFYIVDRVKDMINVSGLKVYSEEVDEIMFGLDGVKRAATIGVPDPERPGSERVKIYVESDPAYDGELSTQDVVDYLDGKIPRQAMPWEVDFIEEIPLTDVGKTDKVALRERESGDR